MAIAMGSAKFMVLFHLFFLLLGILSLFLMTSRIVSFDSLTFWTVVAAIFFNAFFGALWAKQSKVERVEKPMPTIARAYAMVSMVVLTYNQEQNIMRCVNSLFKCAVKYRGSSEIIIVDDGSTDNTFEVAWSTINSKQPELAGTHVKVVRHMSNLGKTEALRAGVNRATGEYIAIVDADTTCEPAVLVEMIDYLATTRRVTASWYHTPSANAAPVAPRIIRLYRSDVLRRLLAENQARLTTEGLEIFSEEI